VVLNKHKSGRNHFFGKLARAMRHGCHLDGIEKDMPRSEFLQLTTYLVSTNRNLMMKKKWFFSAVVDWVDKKIIQPVVRVTKIIVAAVVKIVKKVVEAVVEVVVSAAKWVAETAIKIGKFIVKLVRAIIAFIKRLWNTVGFLQCAH
jgi:hypothetical protein